MISEESGKFLLKYAREILKKHINNKEIKKPKNYPEELDKKYGIFCTLNKTHNLRGCIGLPQPEKPLIDGVEEAVKGSTQDPRFPPVGLEELKKIKIELSILSEMEEIPVEKIKSGDGTVVKKGFNTALFLPQVWEQLPNKKEFMARLCIKAGLSPDEWKDGQIKCYKFHVKVFEEK